MFRLRALIGAVGGIVFLWLMLNVFIGGGLMHWKFWSVQYRDAQREVFESSQSYVQGKISYLTRLRLSYEAAEGPQREALRRTIITEAATVDNDDLPESLQTFITAVSTRGETP